MTDMDIELGTALGVIEDLPKNLKAKISELSDPLGTEVAIWKWVRDPLNEGDIKKIAAAQIIRMLKSNKRAATRAKEEAAREEARRKEQEAAIQAKKDAWATSKFIEPQDLTDAGFRYVNRAVVGKSGSFNVKASLDGDPIISDKGKVWLKDTIEGQEWAKQNKELMAAIKRTQDSFNTSSAEWQVREAEMVKEHWSHVNDVMNKFKEDLRAEWTEELLNSTFQVNGKTVSWGLATVEDHKARIESLLTHAQGTIETAAMHQKAIDDIVANSKSTLSEL